MIRTTFSLLIAFALIGLSGCGPGRGPADGTLAQQKATEAGTVADVPSGVRTLRTLPRMDATFNAIYDRLGNPDRDTGSGRAFLHYDFKNGQTLTLIVGGDRIIAATVTPPRKAASRPAE